MRNMPGDTDLQKEREMTKRMLDGGVYLATAEAFKGEENGWYRITFTVEKDVLLLGLKRFISLSPVLNLGLLMQSAGSQRWRDLEIESIKQKQCRG
jgi:hypothetical protein